MDDYRAGDFEEPEYSNTCKFCGCGELKWVKTKRGWRLCDKITLHKCNGKVLKLIRQHNKMEKLQNEL